MSMIHEELRSISALTPIKFTLQIFGFIPWDRYKLLYYTLVFINHFLSFYFPVSLIVNLFYLDGKVTLLASLSQTFSQIIVLFKILNVFIKKEQFFQLCAALNKLDIRIDSDEETVLLHRMVKACRWFFAGFVCLYCSSGTFCVLSVALSDEQVLKFPAWFPWDIKNSTTGYRVAYYYEIIGIFSQIYMDVICDTYLGLLFWLLTGHLKALGMRVARIGQKPNKSTKQNYQDLIDCIKDHKTCLSCYNLCQDISSRIMLLQFTFTQCILGLTALSYIALNNDLFESFYLCFFFTCMVMEISLCCYCGSKLIKESSDFTKALYSCNWMDQDARFRRVLIIFMQHTQKSWTIWAGGVVTVSLETWLTVLKATYSLFAVLSQLA